jgi:hypothetical protein
VYQHIRRGKLDGSFKGNLSSLVGAEFSKSVPVPSAMVAGTFSLVRRYFKQLQVMIIL